MSTAITPAKLSWTRPADDLWVATASAKFAGEIRQQSGWFYVWDESRRSVGHYSTLATAMNALNQADHLSVRGVLRHDALGQVAVAIGLLALALAVLAVPAYFR